MRIILLVATVMGMAAIGVAAPGQAAGARGGSPHGNWRPIARGPAFDVLRPSRPDLGRRHGRRHGRSGPPDAGFIGYGVGGIGGAYEAVDPHGSGFFAGGGGRVRLEGGRPHYDYDRSYPYEWASAAGAPDGWAEGEAERRPPRCAIEHGIRVCRGGH